MVSYAPSMLPIPTESASPSLTTNAPWQRQEHEVPISAVSPPVRSLLAALAFRDAETAEHSRRVADACVRTARGFLSERELTVIEVAGLLHDIGKIGVPDHILLKPGALTDTEWKLMGMHDRISVEIVANLIASEELLSIIRCHHCRYSGDPHDRDCPVGDDIPVAARILTICDSYDAMVSDRIYRPGRTHDDAVAELRNCAGDQFDPVWVERFIAACLPINIVSARLDQAAPPAVKVVQLSKQMEQLVDAVDLHDSHHIRCLSQRVRTMAQHCQMTEVAQAAQSLEESVSRDDEQWDEVLSKTESLIDLCRAAQDSMVRFTS